MSDVLLRKTTCEYCNETFVTETFLISHLKHVHFICLLCTDKPRYPSQLDLVIHEWINHPSLFTDNININNINNNKN